MAFLDKRPFWKSRAGRVFDILHRHQLPVVLGFRFLYGMRTLTPFLLGAGGFPSLRFLVLNFFGALGWSMIIGTAGYLFGRAVKVLIGEIEHYEVIFFAVLAVLGGVVWLILRHKRRRAEKRDVS